RRCCSTKKNGEELYRQKSLRAHTFLHLKSPNSLNMRHLWIITIPDKTRGMRDHCSKACASNRSRRRPRAPYEEEGRERGTWPARPRCSLSSNIPGARGPRSGAGGTFANGHVAGETQALLQVNATDFLAAGGTTTFV